MKEETPEFAFRARFYPENAAEELIQDITRVRHQLTTSNVSDVHAQL